MPEYNFQVGQQYKKSDIYLICAVPSGRQRGNWDTGYTSFEGDWFIFCSVGIPGRTGHDYANRFVGDELHWVGKTGSRAANDSIASMLRPSGNIFVFYRVGDRDPFTFAGKAAAKSFQDATPVEVVWSFEQSSEQRPEVLAEEVSEPARYPEGATKTITVNVYERNPVARKMCIDHYGVACWVCGFDFEKIYGEIGRGFIHVHHLKQLAEVGEEYEVNPIDDLRPVCPNCHAMLHRHRPALSIEALEGRLKLVS